MNVNGFGLKERQNKALSFIGITCRKVLCCPYNGTQNMRSFKHGKRRRHNTYRVEKEKEDDEMKGYYTSLGYYGLVGGRYFLFTDETEYYEYMNEDEAA